MRAEGIRARAAATTLEDIGELQRELRQVVGVWFSMRRNYPCDTNMQVGQVGQVDITPCEISRTMKMDMVSLGTGSVFGFENSLRFLDLLPAYPKTVSLPKTPSVNSFLLYFTIRSSLEASDIFEIGSLVLGTAGSSIFCYFCRRSALTSLGAYTCLTKIGIWWQHE